MDKTKLRTLLKIAAAVLTAVALIAATAAGYIEEALKLLQ